MNTYKRQQLLDSERAKILGFARSHLRRPELALELISEVEKEVQKTKRSFDTDRAFTTWAWSVVREHCDDDQRKQSFQFRSFDDGTIETLDQRLRKCPGLDLKEVLATAKELIDQLPATAVEVLRMQYIEGWGCEKISQLLNLSVEEVYETWRHSLMFLRDMTPVGDFASESTDLEDEEFWTHALRYIDGAASERYVADLNSQIHESRSRTREFNDLRQLDGLLIEYGHSGEWPAVNDLGAKKKPVQTEAAEPVQEEVKQSQDNEREAETVEPTAAKERDAETSEKPSSPKEKQEFQPVLANENREPGRRNGVHFDNSSPIKRVKVDPRLAKRAGLIAAICLGVCLLIFLGSLFSRQSKSFGSQVRVQRAVDLLFAGDSSFPERGELEPGDYIVKRGTAKLETATGVEILLEGPADFSMERVGELTLRSGRVVASVPSGAAGSGFTIHTKRFSLESAEGEMGVRVGDESADALMFSGEGGISGSELYLGAGDGLRYLDKGIPKTITAEEEVHRYPHQIPAIEAKTYGDNLVINHSFEVGLLSRGFKSSLLYRDIPAGWSAGREKDGYWADAPEQYSGTVELDQNLGGFPKAVDGRRYIWINHGFLSQDIAGIRADVTYEIIARVASHSGLDLGNDKENNRNTYRVGLWSGRDWIAEVSGQLQPGSDFKELRTTFKLTKEQIQGQTLSMMLTGEACIFYDDIVLQPVEE